MRKVSKPGVGWKATLLACAFVSLTSPAVRAGSSPQEEVTRNFTKEATLSGSQGLSLDNRFGQVHVRGVAGSGLKIAATIRVQGGSQAEAQSLADKIRIEVQEAGDGVHVRTVYPEASSQWFPRGRRTSYSVDYDVTMPGGAPLWLRNDFGNVEVAGVKGWSQIDNAHGSLTVRDAGTTKVSNSFGEIVLDGTAGDCTVTNNNGSLRMSNIGGALEARNRFGEIAATQLGSNATITGGNGKIDVSNAKGNVTLTNSFGEVSVRNVGGNLTVRNSNGKISAASVSGNADLGTSFGEVDADSVGGTVTVESSNGGVAIRNAQGFASAKTSFGAISVQTLHKGASLVTGNGAVQATDIDGDVFAKTSFGAVQGQRIHGNLKVQDSNGAVTATDVNGDADVETSFSGVSLTNIGGKVQVANQNGAIEAGLTPQTNCKDVSLRTSFSAIRVRVPGNASYKVDAKTSFGSVSSELPITTVGTLGQDSLTGTIGGGACQMVLRNSNGNIAIVKGP